MALYPAGYNKEPFDVNRRCGIVLMGALHCRRWGDRKE